jgi:hypothetical protein
MEWIFLMLVYTVVIIGSVKVIEFLLDIFK